MYYNQVLKFFNVAHPLLKSIIFFMELDPHALRCMWVFRDKCPQFTLKQIVNIYIYIYIYGFLGTNVPNLPPKQIVNIYILKKKLKKNRKKNVGGGRNYHHLA
jgi:hypothetical protein